MQKLYTIPYLLEEFKTYKGCANKFILFALFSLLAGCTYSVIMNHTEGAASDMVDENQTASPDVTAPITIPAIPGI